MTRGSLWLVATWLLCAPALAQPSPLEQQTAQALFDEGRTLLQQGHTAEACTRCADSQRLDPGGGTLLNLALCHEKLGRLATAYNEYSEALSLAIVARRADRQHTASAALTALAPRLPRLRLRVEAPAPDLRVTLDDQPMPPGLWGQAIPVDPGPHRLAAHAPGHTSFEAWLDLREGATTDVLVAPLARLAPPPTPSATALPLPPAPPCPDGRPRPCLLPRPVERPTLSPVRALSATFAITSFTVAVSFGITAFALQRSAGCDADARRCPDQDALDSVHRARTFAWVSTIATGIGAASGLLYFVWPTPRTRVNLAVSPGSAIIALHRPLP